MKARGGGELMHQVQDKILEYPLKQLEKTKRSINNNISRFMES